MAHVEAIIRLLSPHEIASLIAESLKVIEDNVSGATENCSCRSLDLDAKRTQSLCRTPW